MSRQVAKPRRPVIIAGLVTLLLAVALTVYRSHPLETPAERAHRLCRECGLDPAEIADLIDLMRGWPDRETKLRLRREQFEDAELAELCRPCAVTILDAAESL